MIPAWRRVQAFCNQSLDLWSKMKELAKIKHVSQHELLKAEMPYSTRKINHTFKSAEPFVTVGWQDASCRAELAKTITAKIAAIEEVLEKHCGVVVVDFKDDLTKLLFLRMIASSFFDKPLFFMLSWFTMTRLDGLSLEKLFIEEPEKSRFSTRTYLLADFHCNALKIDCHITGVCWSLL